MLDLQPWLEARNIGYKPPRPYQGGLRFYLNHCPFCNNNSDRPAVFSTPKGLGFHCFHNSCTDKGWSDFRDHYGGPTFRELGLVEEAHERYMQMGPERAPARPYEPEWMSSLELEESEAKLVYYVRECLVADQPMIIGGPNKALKTSIALDLAVSLGTGTAFMGEWEVPERLSVGFISGESGEVTIRDTALAIAAEKGVSLRNADLHVSFSLPAISVQAHVDRLCNDIDRFRFKFLILDPAYLSMLEGAGESVSASNIFTMGPVLRRFAEIGEDSGCTMCLVHHTTKTAGRPNERPPTLLDLSQSGFAEFARQWMLIGRYAEYVPGDPHRLAMNIGGSAGHSHTPRFRITDREVTGLDEKGKECYKRAWEVVKE